MEWQNEEFALAGVNHLALVCSDMKETMAFYTDVLGMRLVKTIELSGSEPVQKAREAAQKARQMVTDPDHPVGKAIQDGVAAAKRKREELEAAAARKLQPINGEDAK